MANRDVCRKHNMIANLQKTPSNVQFHQIIDFLTGSSINYSLLVNPDIIGPWIQEFWRTADHIIQEDESVITATVSGRSIRITEAQIREDLQFNDEESSITFDNEVIWTALDTMGYEGDLTKTTFQKALQLVRSCNKNSKV